MDWLQIVANVAQIVGVLWVLAFGGKAVAEVIRKLRGRMPLKINPLVTLNMLVAAILVVLLGMVVRPIVLPFPNTFSSTSPSTFPSSSSGRQTATPTLIVTPQPQYAYDFEQSTTQGWDTSEGQYKLATLQVVADPIQPGNHVLEIMTKLSRDTNEIDWHTEAKVYFTQGMPAGFTSPPPYNFKGQQVSCQVYLPEPLASGGSPAPSVRLFVKDTQQRNDYGKLITMDSSVVGKWLPVSLVVGKYQEDADPRFDGTQIIAVGVRIDVPSGSSLNYTGPFYVDKCVLPH